MLSIFVFTCISLLRIAFAVLPKQCQENLREFQRSGENRFDASEKDRYFLKIPDCSINLLGIISEEIWILIS